MSDSLGDLARCAEVLGPRARVLAQTGSTNDDARAWAQAGAPHGSVVIADTQAQGRGRHGRVWSSPPGESLAMSVVLRPRVAPTALPPIALVAGLAARRAIDRRLPGPARVKWPNDVVAVEDKGVLRKLAGVLVEGAIAGARVDHVVVGIGINVARTEFPAELESIATSLARSGAEDLDRSALALDLLEALDDELAAWTLAPDTIGARLRPHDAIFGRPVLLEGQDGGQVLGVADGIAPDGRLRVLVGQELRLAHAGEVRLA